MDGTEKKEIHIPFGCLPLLILLWLVLCGAYGVIAELGVPSGVELLEDLTVPVLLLSLCGAIGILGLLLLAKKPEGLCLPIAFRRLIIAFLCLWLGFLAEITLGQPEHYSSWNAGDIISTADPDTDWETLNFLEQGYRAANAYGLSVYYSSVDVDISDEERYHKLSEILHVPDNAMTESDIDFGASLAVVRIDTRGQRIRTAWIEPVFLPEDNLLCGDKVENFLVQACYLDKDGEVVISDGLTVTKQQSSDGYIVFDTKEEADSVYICFGGIGAAFLDITLNETLPLSLDSVRVALVALVLFVLCCLRGREDRENLVCFVLVGLWVLWHLIHGLGCLTEYVSTGITLDYNRLYGIYWTSFSLLGWLTVAGAAICVLPRLNRRKPWFVLFGLLLLWSAICAAVSGSWQEQWEGTAYRLDGLRSYLFYGAVLLCASRVRKGRLGLLRMFAWSAIAEALLVLFQVYGLPGVMDYSMTVGAGTFFNTNHCGYYLTMSMLCALGLYLFDTGKMRRTVHLLSFGIQYFALLCNDTFGCVLAVWCGVAVLFILYFMSGKGKKLEMLPPMVLLLGISGACFRSIIVNISDLFSGVFHVIQQPDSSAADSAGSGRIKIWKATLGLIEEKPVFGWGPEGCADLLTEAVNNDRPHNEYLQYAAFLGIPGLCLYMGGLVSLCVNRLKALRSLDAATLVAGGAVMGYMVSAMFGNTMFYTSPLFFLLLGLVAAEEDEMKGEPCSTVHPE